jgi:hypothetical protein
MERRMWYTPREKYLQGKIKLEYIAGKDTPAVRLTKLGTAEEHIRYMTDMLGLNLLGLNHYPLSEVNEINKNNKDSVNLLPMATFFKGVRKRIMKTL